MNIFSLFLIIAVVFCPTQNDGLKQSQDNNQNIYKLINVESIQNSDKDPNAKILEGSIKIEDQQFNVRCDCNVENEISDPILQCNPSKIQVVQEKVDKQGELNKGDIEKIIGNPSQMLFVNAEKASFECVDGRNTNPVLATLGGDAGEFILGLQVYESMKNFQQQLTQSEVDMLFEKYLQKMEHKNFIMCIDDQALQHLETTVERQIDLSYLLQPSKADYDELLEGLIQPENIGCSHIKNLIKYPEFYSIRKDLVQSFLISFYQTLWNGKEELKNKLVIRNLVGIHKEIAFVEIKSNQACSDAKLAPLIKPKNKDKQIFTYHQDDILYRRQFIANFFAQQSNTQDHFDRETMLKRIQKIGMQHLAVTGSFIAKNLPFYTLKFE